MNMVRRSKIALMLVSLVLASSSSGCATYRTLEHGTAGSPKFFSGTRLDWHAFNDNKVALKKFKVDPPEYPLLDLPASFVLDLAISPLSGGFVIYEAIVGAK